MSQDARISALETQWASMKEQWRVVQQAPMANARLLNSLRETQLEHSLKLEEHDRRFDDVDRRFDDVDRRFDGVDRQLHELRQGVLTIVGMLSTLIDRDNTDTGRSSR